MNHSMKLYEFPFDLIKDQLKVVEIRLNDLKRQKLKLEDTITFSKLPELTEQLTVKITSLSRYKTFEDLVEDTPLQDGGPHWKNKKDVIKSGLGFYPSEKEQLYGYLKIGIELIY